MQYREDGRRVRESLQTENRKVADELRLRRVVELGQKRLGLAVPAVAVAASAPAVVAPPVAVALPVSGSRPAENPETIRAEYVAWSNAHKRPKTVFNDQRRLDAFFASVPGMALRGVRTADVERHLVAESKRGMSPTTILRNREILHGFWRWAVRQGHADKNVVSDIPRPRLPERDPVFLNLEQVEELLRAVAGTEVEAPIATAVFAGLRREELCWLTRADLERDGEPWVLRVRAKTIDGESWQPKTKRDRKIPVSPRLREVLVRHLEAIGKAGALWLFPSPNGCRLDPDNLSRAFRAVTKAKNLAWNLLELRHTFGSQLARKGVSLLKIARLMGNSPFIASKHYINLVPEEMADEVAF